METSRVDPSPRRAAWLVARLRPVGLAAGVANSSVLPSQSNESGTRYGIPSADALATQRSTSVFSRASVSRRRCARDRIVMVSLPLLLAGPSLQTVGRYLDGCQRGIVTGVR